MSGERLDGRYERSSIDFSPSAKEEPKKLILEEQINELKAELEQIKAENAKLKKELEFYDEIREGL